MRADELRQFLAPLDLHPLQLMHCLDSDIDPGVLSFANTVLIEYPAAFVRIPAMVTSQSGLMVTSNRSVATPVGFL